MSRPVHPLPGDSERQARLLALLDAFPARRVAVVGDLIADEFIYGRVARVSREAPVLILQYDSTEIVPGGAGNAASNVAALGARAHLIGFAGKDEAGKRLRSSLRHVDTKGAASSRRILHACEDENSGRRRAHGETANRANRPRCVERARREKPKRVRARRVEGGGRVRRDSAVGLRDRPRDARARARTQPKVATRSRRRPVPILVDSRYDLLRYRGLTACTPNESEVEQMFGVKIGDSLKALERAGRELLKRTRMNAVLITRGSRGMALFEPGRPTIHVPIYGSDEVADVTGAGDTVIATMTLAIAAGASFYEAARLANYAGGLVVMKRGTATVSPEELREAVRRG